MSKPPPKKRPDPSLRYLFFEGHRKNLFIEIIRDEDLRFRRQLTDRHRRAKTLEEALTLVNRWLTRQAGGRPDETTAAKAS
jgi:hypothetical protein